MDKELSSEDQKLMEEMRNAEEQTVEEKEQPDAEVREEEGRQEEVAAEDKPEDKEPEFKTTREKPPEGFVPHAAMHQERVKRQELEKKIAELEAKVSPPETPQEPQWVDPLEDPEGHRKWQEHNYSKLQDRLDREEQQRQQTFQAQQRMERAAQLEQEFAQKTPDYSQATQFLHQQKVAELQAMGYGDQEIQAQISRDANAIFDAASSAGINPAQLLYMRAKEAGYQNTPEASEKVTKLAEAQKQTQGVGSAGGGKQSGRLTPTDVANMSEREFEKAKRERPDEIRAAMGG